MSKIGLSERRFTTLSGVEVEPFYEASPCGELPAPGEFPYTRGIHRDMYRGKLWTMRQFSGFATPEETNARYHYLLEQGQTGLSVAFDLPTLMGYDADDAMAEGEVGKCGAPVSSLEDMEILLRGLPLDKISISMTINSPAAILWAMYLAVAAQQGVEWSKLSGTLQNDILKEYIAQKEFIYPPRPSMRLVTDTIEFGSRHTPRFNPISISGYHIREAGSTAVQELAFTLRDGVEYVEWALETGLKVDEFAPRLSFFFNAHNDFFEEIAKYRAARRLWAREMKARFRPENAASLALRFHTQTAGCALTAQQPYNNVVRVTLQALAAVLGGTQSLHTNSLDETLALPTEEAVKIALRTQQIIAQESGVANTVDPLAGSYYLEWLTNRMESEAKAYFDKLDEMGGMVQAIQRGFPQSEIHGAAVAYQKETDNRERVIVGVNAYTEPEERRLRILKIKGEVEKKQVQRLKQSKKSRSAKKVAAVLSQLAGVAEANGDLMPEVIEAVRAQSTVGEICEVFRRVYGQYREAVSL